ncbi:MAG: NUDIX hydrolase, partial [Bacteroidota bacterium]|nr:NUDIX hydrolase [Bacteroidota bacterium]
MPDGSESEYHSIETPGSVMIVPVDGEGRFLMVRQYRYLNGRESLEFPGGGIVAGLTVEESAVRELVEEAGCVADDMRVLGTHNPWNGVTGELCTVFLARGLHPACGVGDPGEECVVESI